MGKYIVGAFVLIIIIAGGFYFLHKGSSSGVQPSSQTGAVATAMATSTYATSSFSVIYPNDFSVDSTYSYTGVNPKKPIAGVKFTVPMAMATGTNLSADSYVSIEQLPHAKNCTGDIYLLANVHPHSMSDDGVSYSFASSSSAGAGNFYEEDVYALSGSTPCTAVRYFIHSTDIGHYPAGSVQAFDQSALMSAFDSIRHSLTLTQTP